MGKTKGRTELEMVATLPGAIKPRKKPFLASVLEQGLCLQGLCLCRAMCYNYEEGLKGGERQCCGVVALEDHREFSGQLNNFSLFPVWLEELEIILNASGTLFLHPS